jgi:hypothetical protein
VLGAPADCAAAGSSWAKAGMDATAQHTKAGAATHAAIRDRTRITCNPTYPRVS